MDFGLLVIRVVVGALLIGHGTQKLFGWYGGHGLEGTGGFFESLGYRPGKPHAFLAGLGEAGGGLLLLLGFLTPLAAAALVGVMMNAIGAVHAGKGPWVTDGGWEYPAVVMTIAAGVGIAGPGSLSVDGAFGLPVVGLLGIAGIVVGVLAGAVTLSRRQPEGAEEPAAEEEPADEHRRRAA